MSVHINRQGELPRNNVAARYIVGENPPTDYVAVRSTVSAWKKSRKKPRDESVSRTKESAKAKVMAFLHYSLSLPARDDMMHAVMRLNE